MCICEVGYIGQSAWEDSALTEKNNSESLKQYSEEKRGWWVECHLVWPEMKHSAKEQLNK